MIRNCITSQTKTALYLQQVAIVIVLKTRPPAAQCVQMCLFSARSGSDIGTLMDLFEYDQINGKHSMINAPRTFPGFMSMFLPS